LPSARKSERRKVQARIQADAATLTARLPAMTRSRKPQAMLQTSTTTIFLSQKE
jgi:hypothetical protein